MWKNGILIGEDYNALIESFNILKYVSPTGWKITVREKEVEWWGEYQKITQKQKKEDIEILVNKVDDNNEIPGDAHLTNWDTPGSGTKIDFPKMQPKGVGQKWVNLLIYAYYLNRPKIVELVDKGNHGHIIKEWVKNIGSELQYCIENNVDKIVFFKRIYPDIKKYKSEIPGDEFKTFKGVFLNKVFETLDVEEFGQPGESVNPGMHLVVSTRSNFVKNIVNKVIEPGYRRTTTGEVIIKVLVEL